MANISEDQIDAMNRNLTQLSGVMGKMAAKLSATEKGRKEAVSILDADVKARKTFVDNAKEVGKNLKGASDKLSQAGRSAEDFAIGLENAAKAIPGGFLLASLVTYTKETVDVYKDLSNIGQTFGGSMVQMSMAAGAAGLGLKDFQKATLQNSAVVATLGQGFFAINKDVRKAAEGMGLYGMSLDQLNTFSGSYLEQQRLTGALTRAGQTRQVRAINELAQSVSGVATITGVARDKIMEIAQTALRSPTLVAVMSGNTARGMHAYNDAITKAVTMLAGQTGKAGTMLSEGLSETIALGGSQFSQKAQTMLDAGFGEGALFLQQAADKLARGIDPEQVNMELINSMKAAADNPATRDALLNQARAGNQQAQEVLEMTQNLKSYTRAEIEAAKAANKRKDMLTGFATSFESIFSKLRGSLVEGFLTPFGLALGGTNFEETLKNLEEVFKPLEETFKGMGKAWGEQMHKFLTGDGLKNFVAGLGNATKLFGEITATIFTKENVTAMLATARVIGELGLILGAFTMGVVVPTLSAVVKGLNMFNGFLTSVFEFFKIPEGKTMASIITAGLLITIGLVIKSFFGNIVSRIMGNMMGSVDINAGVVNVNGGVGGLGGGGGGRGRGRGRGGRGGGGDDGPGRRGRAGDHRARRGGTPPTPPTPPRPNRRGLGGLFDTLGGAAGRIGGRGAARAGGKSLLKKIPGIGLLAGLGFGAQRALGGDLVGGGLELASGIAGTLPGLGTAASLGIDGLLMARDGGLMGGNGQQQGNNRGAARPRNPSGGGRNWGRMLGIGVAGAGIAGVGGYAAAQAFNGPNQRMDTQGQSDRMRESNRAVGQERTMEGLLAEMRKTNQLLDEGRQISTAQLERQIEQNNIARGTNGAIQDGRQ